MDSNFSLDDGFMIISESREKIGTKVLKNVATRASDPFYNPRFRYPGNPERIRKLWKQMKIQVNNKYLKVYRKD